MKFICNGCAKWHNDPCILDLGEEQYVSGERMRCPFNSAERDRRTCKWEKYEEGEVANLQPTCNQLATGLPKLTAEVFDRPDCPEWARIAVVNRNGKAYYGGYKDAIINCSGGWQGLYDEQGKWKRIGNELFDATDWQNSLIERPAAKLPDWRKVGQWVWDKRNGYGKIKSVRDDRSACYIEFDGGAGDFVPEALAELKLARLRPYNAEEMKELVGKIVCDTDGNNEMITGWSVDMEKVRIGSIYYSAQRLLDEKFTIDGKPCGCLEHLENGEWVK